LIDDDDDSSSSSELCLIESIEHPEPRQADVIERFLVLILLNCGGAAAGLCAGASHL
jgi:hypothetical protein